MRAYTLDSKAVWELQLTEGGHGGRERRCHCLMVVLCCHCCRATDRETGEQPPYARMGQLFSQVELQE